MKWSGAEMRCPKCNKYLPDRCICNGPSAEERRAAPIAAQLDQDAERAAFEKHFGPKDSFAWRNEDGTYKVGTLQSAWTIWQAARRAAPAAAQLDADLPQGIRTALAEVTEKLEREAAENLSLRMENRQFAERIRLLTEELAERKPSAGWRAIKTVGDMVSNLLTLDQTTPIHAAFHVDYEGARRCRTRPVSISRERVIDGKWVDVTRKDVPYAVIVWAKQDERAQQPAQSIGNDPQFQEMAGEVYNAGAHNDSMETSLNALIAYIDGRTAGTAPEGWKLVPIDSTIAMDDAGHDALLGMGTNAMRLDAEVCYSAMIAAAPSPRENTNG